jgi:NADPH-dependent 2,4-dienoyl-CoA reductase/sulfur reductase-like enzyme
VSPTVSPAMSPSANNEGFQDHANGIEIVNSIKNDTVQDVIIAGAGPAGLMLA